VRDTTCKSETRQILSTMKQQSVLVLLACVLGVLHAAPLEENTGVEAGNCQDAFVQSAGKLALDKINKDRKEGYMFSLHRVSNANLMKHGDTGVVFYLTLDVLETNCHVLSRKDSKSCPAREVHDIPVYGQCKAAIYINKPHRVVRLYKYDCVMRPAAATKIHGLCPDCPSLSDKEDKEIVKTVTLAMEKFNKEHGLANHFALLNITRASSSMGMATFYHAQFTIQETTCANSTSPAEAAKCPLMECEFAHKGFCKASHAHSMGPEESGEDPVSVECEIFEPEAADREKKLHLLGGETDHAHTDNHPHDPKHDQAHDATEHSHDHAHDHTKSHTHNDKHTHEDGGDHHHHVHAHADGKQHDHAHAHDHGHDHDHEHTHHAKAHDHSGDAGPHSHHDYAHAPGTHTHEHDHEKALDHDHKHAHLHAHEHHHHHHEHPTPSARHPEGSVRELTALDRPTTLPSFPEQPVGGEQGVTGRLVEDPEIPMFREPTILPFPSAVSAQCPAPYKEGDNQFMKELFAEDPLFKSS